MHVNRLYVAKGLSLLRRSLELYVAQALNCVNGLHLVKLSPKYRECNENLVLQCGGFGEFSETGFTVALSI